MDAYLTQDARRSMEALVRLGGARGYLVGHRRGPRFVVESIFPSPAGRRFSGADLRVLEGVLDSSVIGFFAAGPGRAAAKTEALRPFGCGKLFVEARLDAAQGLALEAFSVEFKGRFALASVAIAPSRARRER